MMYKIVITGKFKRDLKLAKKRGYNLSLLSVVVNMLAAGEPLPEKYKDHNLSGNYAGCKRMPYYPGLVIDL